jgi:hypothetical protein
MLPTIILATATCYFRNGNVASSGYVPCNVSATGLAGSHSACCFAPHNDVCLSSGLCLYPGPSGTGYSLLNANGCTDKNLQDSSCQTFCPSTSDAGQAVMSCGNGNYCCIDFTAATATSTCCGGTVFQLSNGVGLPINQKIATTSAVTATETAAGHSQGSTDNHSTVIAVSSVLATLLAVSLSAIAFLAWKLRRLQSGSGGLNVTTPSGIMAHVKGEKDPGEAVQRGPYELSEYRG